MWQYSVVKKLKHGRQTNTCNYLKSISLSFSHSCIWPTFCCIRLTAQLFGGNRLYKNNCRLSQSDKFQLPVRLWPSLHNSTVHCIVTVITPSVTPCCFANNSWPSTTVSLSRRLRNRYWVSFQPMISALHYIWLHLVLYCIVLFAHNTGLKLACTFFVRIRGVTARHAVGMVTTTCPV